MHRLTTNLCGQNLKSPFILGSGTLGENKIPLIKSLDYGAGAIVNRTVRVNNKDRTPFKIRYYIDPQQRYMLNADNNNQLPWTYWPENIDEIQTHGPLIMSVSARVPEDAGIVAQGFTGTQPAFWELNFSCSHSAKIYGRIGYDSVRKALEQLKEQTKVPALLKLSLDSIDMNQLVALEQSGLLDGYVISNTIGPGLKVNVDTRQPVLSSVYGGVSGAAIKPLVLAKIHEFRDYTELPIVGVGGIETAEDALEFLIVGCDAVQVYTRAHREGLQVFRELNKDLLRILTEQQETVESVKGTLNIPEVE
jgi:dihydroorotate dehydrogenase (NAD+) catalytic subunit